MTVLRFALASACFLAVPASAFAQLPTLPDCEKPTSSMVEIGGCLDRKYAEADAELNRVYQDVLRVLEPAQSEILRRAQRAWIAQRELDFALIETFTGGNHPSIRARPVEILVVRQRSAFLKALIGKQ